MRIVIVGAGPGGICLGINLLKAGFRNFTILEKAPQIGGTWWHNIYPGAECDVRSHLYSFSFALKPDWRRPYATQPEILSYLEDCVERFKLTPHIQCGVEVRSAHWNGQEHTWTVTTQSGDRHEADVLVSAVGMFNDIAMPDLPGLDGFNGTVFHSARWRKNHQLDGRSVAIIGSAASAVQIAPRIAPKVAKLSLFQRTATWVMPKEDAPYDEETIAHLRANPVALRHFRLKVWRDLQDLLSYDPAALGKAEEAGRGNISAVKDPTLRKELTPTFSFGRKRPLFSNEYYPMFNRANVELVTDAIERIEPDGIVTRDGERRPVDTIIMATGFATTKFAAAIDICGEDGRSLDAAWSDGAEAYLGIVTAGFPNLFMLYGPNTNGGSIIFMIECQAAYIVRQLRRMRNEGIVQLRVRKDIQDLYNVQLQEDLSAFEIYAERVNTYYRAENGRIVTQCPYNMRDYRELTAMPDPEAYDAVRAP